MSLSENHKTEIPGKDEVLGSVLKLPDDLAAKINRLIEFPKNEPERQTETFDKEEKTILKDQYEQHMDDYRFYLDFALKANGVFYAVLGAILSLYFSNNSNLDKGLVIFFLLVPIVVSLILGGFCLVGAYVWGGASKKFRAIAQVLEIVIVHQVGFLTWLLYIFGTLFVAIGVALIFLMVHLIRQI